MDATTPSMTDAQLRDLEALQSALDEESEFEGVDEVTLNDIRHKLEVYCFDCPIHWDEKAAQAHGYRTIVAPAAMVPVWIVPPYWTPGEPTAWAPGLRERNGTRRLDVATPSFPKGFNAAAQWEAFEPLYVGDRLKSTYKMVELNPRTTRLGTGVFVTQETRLSKQTGELVLVNRNTQYRYQPTDERVREAQAKPVEQPPATEQPKESDPNVDWSKQIRFGDGNVDDEVPLYSIWLNYQRIVMSVAADRMWGSIHHNRELARAQGLDDTIFNTRGYEMVFEITLRRWIGLDGRIVKMGPFRMVKNSHPGDTISCHAKVTGKEVKDGQGLVQLEIGVDNPRAEAARGEATVALPL